MYFPTALDFRSKGVLQCGRIYKDAEIMESPPISGRGLCAFNVAASIKMRKCTGDVTGGRGTGGLQCGRIYKDAEINHG